MNHLSMNISQKTKNERRRAHVHREHEGYYKSIHVAIDASKLKSLSLGLHLCVDVKSIVDSNHLEKVWAKELMNSKLKLSSLKMK